MKNWTVARVKSHSQSGIISRYNLEMRKALGDPVHKFYVASGMISGVEVNILPDKLFICFGITEDDKIIDLVEQWKKLDPEVYYLTMIQAGEKLQPIFIPDNEISEFIAASTRWFTQKVSLDYDRGESIEVISGPLRGLKGTVVEIRKDKVLVSLTMFNKPCSLLLLKTAISGVA